MFQLLVATPRNPATKETSIQSQNKFFYPCYNIFWVTQMANFTPTQHSNKGNKIRIRVELEGGLALEAMLEAK